MVCSRWRTSRGGKPTSLYQNQCCLVHGTACLHHAWSTYLESSYFYELAGWWSVAVADFSNSVSLVNISIYAFILSWFLLLCLHLWRHLVVTLDFWTCFVFLFCPLFLSVLQSWIIVNWDASMLLVCWCLSTKNLLPEVSDLWDLCVAWQTGSLWGSVKHKMKVW